MKAMLASQARLHNPNRAPLPPLRDSEVIDGKTSNAMIDAIYDRFERGKTKTAKQRKHEARQEAEDRKIQRQAKDADRRTKMDAFDQMSDTRSKWIAESPAHVAELIEIYGYDCVWNAQSQVASINDEAGMRAACERLKKKYPL